MSDATERFRAAIVAAGLTPPECVNSDGKLHRFSANGRRGDDSGWYCLHLDGLAAGVFGCWRTGLKSTWCAKSETAMTQGERQAHAERINEMKEQRDTDKAQAQAKACETAAALWEQGDAEVVHPYLTAKCVKACGVKVFGDTLLIPMQDTAGKLHSLQTVDSNGDKLFHFGGRVMGCYHAIGKPIGADARLIVCEGYATGASIHEATGLAVAVAFTAGNLEAVALALRAKHPAIPIVIATDDDHLTEGNTGLTKAKAAALAVGGLVAVPTFAAGRPSKATDFNDLHALQGLAAVRSSIDGASPITAETANDWPEATPLPDALPPVMPFEADLLPAALRGWVMDISHRMQCPADFPAVAALVALSSLIGARAVVQPKARDDWQVVPNLWGAVVGRPGVKKSPAMSEALRPLHRLQEYESERSQLVHGAWALDCKVMAMQDDANEKKAKGLAAKDPAAARALLEPAQMPEEPTARRFIVNDATVEKLGELMQQNEWGTLSYRDELYGLLTSLDKQGQEGSRAFMLQSYDGNQGYTFDRIGRGTVHVPRVCLAMIGGIQPGRMQEYVRGAVAGGGADDGLLQRFGLTVWPDVSVEYVHVDQWPDTPARQTAWAVFERLALLQPASDSEPVIWRFSEAAQALFVEWLVPFEIELRGDDLHPAMVSHLAKYRKLVPALALVFALIDTPDSDGVIHESELLRALAMSQYLRTHAKRLYAAAETPETAAAAMLLTRIKASKLADRDGVMPGSFAPRTVAQKGWAGLTTLEAVRGAAELLTEYGYLRREIVQASAVGGRPSERYAINPKIGGAV